MLFMFKIFSKIILIFDLWYFTVFSGRQFASACDHASYVVCTSTFTSYRLAFQIYLR